MLEVGVEGFDIKDGTMGVLEEDNVIGVDEGVSEVHLTRAPKWIMLEEGAKHNLGAEGGNGERGAGGRVVWEVGGCKLVFTSVDPCIYMHTAKWNVIA